MDVDRLKAEIVVLEKRLKRVSILTEYDELVKRIDKLRQQLPPNVETKA